MVQARFQILSLSGGGYRGLYTAAVLAELERAAGQPIGRCFDLVTGTSIGGILAIAVAFEVDMQRAVDAFKEAGARIFPKQAPTHLVGKALRHLEDYRQPPGDSGALRALVEALVGGDSRLADAKHALAIPAVNLTQGRPQVFKTRHYAGVQRDLRVAAADVAMATSAAPTFFPPARIGDCLYADGGLFANSPDLIGFHEATHFLQLPRERVYMVSIGTTTSKYSIADVDGETYGTGFWVLHEEHRLPNALISAQQQFAEQITVHLLQDRYIRIDTEPSHEQAPYLGLDKVTPVATRTLLGLGAKAGTDALGVAEVRDILSHTAATPLLPE